MRNRPSYSLVAVAFAVSTLATVRLRFASAESSSCHDLQVSQAICLESYSECMNNRCEPIQLPPDATCFYANYVLCKHRIPSCCCGTQIVETVQCLIPNCEINCDTLVEASATEMCASESMQLTACQSSLQSGLRSSNECSSSGQECLDWTTTAFHAADATCRDLNNFVCSGLNADCCCRQEFINAAQCNFAKRHGVECEISCDEEREPITNEPRVTEPPVTTETVSDLDPNSATTQEGDAGSVAALNRGDESAAIDWKNARVALSNLMNGLALAIFGLGI